MVAEFFLVWRFFLLVLGRKTGPKFSWTVIWFIGAVNYFWVWIAFCIVIFSQSTNKWFPYFLPGFRVSVVWPKWCWPTHSMRDNSYKQSTLIEFFYSCWAGSWKNLLQVLVVVIPKEGWARYPFDKTQAFRGFRIIIQLCCYYELVCDKARLVTFICISCSSSRV